MNKYMFWTSALLVSMNASANVVDMRQSHQQQLLDGFELKKSIQQYEEQKSGAFVTVGDDNDCDFRLGTTKIQDAIDAEHTEIRIASNQIHNENLIINDISLTLKGGYVDCATAETGIQTGTSDIRGVSTGAVIIIVGDTERNNIVLDSLSLYNGSVGLGLAPGGGISVLLADAAISINKTIITANRSSVGGGLSVIQGNADVLLNDTNIFFNNADSGGGLYCVGAESSILMEGNSGISSNTADGTSGSFNGEGGGIYVSTDCDFTSYSGTAGAGFAGISGNKAYRHGGGIYASSGASVVLYGYERCLGGLCSGDNTNPVNLNDNIADFDGVGGGNGGGAYITGGPTGGLAVYAAKITDNQANNGGAFYITDGGALLIERNAGSCWDLEHCNHIAGNKTNPFGGLGGVVYNNGSLVNITNTVIENNRASIATVIYGVGSDSKTTLKGSVIHHNGDNGAGGYGDTYVFRAQTDAEIDVHFSTVADNNAETAVFGMAASAAATSEVHSSIVHDASSGDVYSSTSSQVSNDCSIFHESASIPLLESSSIVDNPDFVDRNNNDYHIQSNSSPAVDFCDDLITTADHPDMDFEAYGFDDPSVVNILGPYDVGADETYSSDIIFKNGYE